MRGLVEEVEAEARARDKHRAFVAAFQEAAARWKQGDFSARFPLYSLPPRVVPGRVSRTL